VVRARPPNDPHHAETVEGLRGHDVSLVPAVRCLDGRGGKNLGITAGTYLLEDALLKSIRHNGWVTDHLPALHALASYSPLVAAGLCQAVLGAAIGVLGVFIALFAGHSLPRAVLRQGFWFD
jgi:hypothetical protein